jgi:uncharacterized membrane protein YhfC
VCLIDLLLPVGYVVSGILMVALPLMGIYLLRRKRDIGLAIFGAATLTFFVSQLLYIPLNYALEFLVSGWLLISSSILTVAIILGVFMAMAEESLRFLVLRHFKGAAGSDGHTFPPARHAALSSGLHGSRVLRILPE